MMENACILKDKRTTMERNQDKDGVALRKDAEIRVLEKALQYPENLSFQPPEIIYETFYELQANPSEVEMHNEEIRRVRAEKDESLRRMAGAVAHHYNNQLTVIMGSLELFLGDLPENAENCRNLHHAMKAAKKAAAMGRQLLNYLGHPPGSIASLNLSECCSQSLARLQSEMAEEIFFNHNFPDFGPIIHADKEQIHQILSNLVTNGGESVSGSPGTITLTITTVSPEDIPTSKCIPVDWQAKDNSYACLEVSDTGCGIADVDIQKIFDPFFTTKLTGRGMGLPVVLEFVKNLGGCITVDSVPGDGSVFRVYLPVSVK